MECKCKFVSVSHGVGFVYEDIKQSMIKNIWYTRDRNKITSETSNYPIQIVRDSTQQPSQMRVNCLEVGLASGQTSEYNVDPHECQGLN